MHGGLYLDGLYSEVCGMTWTRQLRQNGNYIYTLK